MTPGTPAAPATGPGRTLRALLVGIDAYRDPVPPLRGCVRDVGRVEQLLRARAAAAGDAFDVRVLRDGEATRAAVVQAFRSHLAGAGPSDTALFYYSGHGSQQPSPPSTVGGEPDALDETLVLADSRDPGGFDLADTELGQLVAEVAQVAGHVLVILDCCHSGSGVRDVQDGARVRRAPADERPRAADTYLTAPDGRFTAPAGRATATGSPQDAAPTAPGGRYVLLSACRADQTAKEVEVDGAQRGAFSAALESALSLGGRPDYLTVQRSVAAAVRNLASDQLPVLEAPVSQDVRLPFLGGVATPEQPLLTASYVERVGWVLDAGRLHGLPSARRDAPTVVDLYPLLGADGTPSATARVVQARAASSLLTPVGPATLDRDLTYRAVVTSAPQPEITLAVVGDGAAAGAVRSGLRTSTVLRLLDGTAGPDAGTPDVVVRADGDRLTLLRPGTASPLATVDGAAEPDAVDRVVAACEHIGRWLGIWRRANPGSPLTDLVDLTVRDHAGDPLPQPDGRLEVAYTGSGEGDSPVIAVSYTNRWTGPLHCAVLVLTESYGVECLTTGGSVLLAPGETAWVTDEADRPQLRTTLPEGSDRTTDLLKLVVSVEPFDAQAMNQAELDPSRLTVSDPSGTDRGITRKAALPAGQDWATRDVLITTARPGA